MTKLQKLNKAKKLLVEAMALIEEGTENTGAEPEAEFGVLSHLGIILDGGQLDELQRMVSSEAK